MRRVLRHRPWYLLALPSRASVELDLNAQRGTDELTESVLKSLATLADIQVPGGVSASAWRVVVDGPERSFYRHRHTLLTAGLIESNGSTKMPRYLVSDAVIAALPKDCQTTS